MVVSISDEHFRIAEINHLEEDNSMRENAFDKRKTFISLSISNSTVHGKSDIIT